jgi:hypothetical protein
METDSEVKRERDMAILRRFTGGLGEAGESGLVAMK